VSGLDDLTREELIALVLKLHETVELQAKRIIELEAIVQAQAERISALEEEVSRLGGSKPKPAWVKPNAPKKEKGPRKKRSQSFARHNLPATQVRYHVVENCPDCGRKLCGGSVKWRHQVVEIPEVHVDVIDHLFVERRCGVCGKRWTPDASSVLSDVVVGKRSVGIGLMSLIAYLKTACRVPIGLIRQLLGSLYGVNVSKGEIAELLHAVAEIGQVEYDALLDKVRGSPVVHGDETGWREDGKNGYLWSFSAPLVRYFTYNHSRAGAVVTEVLGDEFVGVLVSDFYGGYNIYEGVKQRCWVHYIRDLKALAEKYPAVATWVDRVLAVYWRARESVKMELREIERCRLRQGFESELLALAQPYLKLKNAPQRVLAQRIDRFLGELFVFVQYPEVPSENNAAERAIRPAVIARKVSGGTRSPRGSKTSSVLRSLFETWTLEARNGLDACREMIVESNRTSLLAPS
jgi:transposase